MGAGGAGTASQPILGRPLRFCQQCGKECRNQGDGTEAIRLAAKYAFGELGLDIVAMTAYPNNGRAIIAYAKVGFEATRGLEKAWLRPDGLDKP